MAPPVLGPTNFIVRWVMGGSTNHDTKPILADFSHFLHTLCFRKNNWLYFHYS